MKKIGLPIVVLLVFLCAGCGSSATNTGAAPASMTLHVVRIVTIPSDYRAFSRTIRDATTVRQLYQAAIALAKAPSGIINCPNDIGLVYQLNFQQGESTQQMNLHASGCQFLSISQTDIRQTTPSFRALVAHVIGLPSLLTN